MSWLSKLQSWLVGPRPVSANYRPAPQPRASLRIDELPPFSLHAADLMRFDPQVRIGLGARNGLAMGAEIEIDGARPVVVDWVRRQWNRIWATSAHQLLRAKLYGFAPFEVMYRHERSDEAQGDWPNLSESYRAARQGSIGFSRLIDRHPRDARLLAHDGQTVGFSLARAEQKPLTLIAPKALVCTFDAEFGNPYGCSLLERAYPPWYEKWMDGGAKKTLRLRMIKDAYIGDIVWYPPDRKVQLPGGEEISWRDVAREMLESRLSGGALALPLLYDRDGRKLMDYTPPQDVRGSTHIFDWKRDVDLEIWKALEVPPEIIEASASGSGYAGRSIPLMVALAAVQVELNEIVACIDRDILRPLARLNFGDDDNYEIHPRSLIETYGVASGEWRVASEEEEPSLGVLDEE